MMVTKLNQAAYYCDNVQVNMKKSLDISCALLELHVDVKENLYRIFYWNAPVVPIFNWSHSAFAQRDIPSMFLLGKE